MRIDGAAIADTILSDLTRQVSELKTRGITPALAVILVGDDPGSLSYIRQKQKAAERIGARLLFEHLPASITPTQLESAITHYNNDPAVHGLIVQRPVPQFIGDVGDVLLTVHRAKDVDGFLPDSPFEVPVARAVMTILAQAHDHLTHAGLVREPFAFWLAAQNIVIIGRGETAGAPVAALLAKHHCTTSVVHSKTPNPGRTIKQASVIVSCVGKERVVTKHMISRGVILISVGLTRGADGKLHGDYDEENISDTASFYTPTPGGVGPVNVASLMHNLVDACIMEQP